jgi:hypothetical protein
LVPGLFQNTGSTTIARLHERMIVKRRQPEHVQIEDPVESVMSPLRPPSR